MKKVSVIIPSYNRAHILKNILPSYFQQNVGEVILVNDCSTDNTRKIVQEFAVEYPDLVYLEHKTNSGQCVAKNSALEIARFEYVYFGDDDSYISDDAISVLLDTFEKEQVDVVGARALYEISNGVYVKKSKQDIIDLEDNFHTNWSVDSSNDIDLPVLPACSLMRTDLALKIKFDPVFKGNGFREESDFFLRAKRLGAKLFFQPRASQINLPRHLSTGGSWKMSKLMYEFWAIRNTYIFYRRHWPYLKNHYGFKRGTAEMFLLFIISRFSHILKMIKQKFSYET